MSLLSDQAIFHYISSQRVITVLITPDSGGSHVLWQSPLLGYDPHYLWLLPGSVHCLVFMTFTANSKCCWPQQTLLAPALISKPVNFGLLNIRSLNNKSFLCHDFITFNNLDFFYNHRDLVIWGRLQSSYWATPPILHTYINPDCQAGEGGLLSFTGMFLNALPF